MVLQSEVIYVWFFLIWRQILFFDKTFDAFYEIYYKLFSGVEVYKKSTKKLKSQ